MVGPVGEPDRRERVASLGSGDPTRYAGVLRSEGDVLERGQGWHEVEALEHEAHLGRPHPRSLRIREAGAVWAIDPQLSLWPCVAVGGVEQPKNVHEGAL